MQAQYFGVRLEAEGLVKIQCSDVDKLVKLLYITDAETYQPAASGMAVSRRRFDVSVSYMSII